MPYTARVERLVQAPIAEVRDALLRMERIRRWFPVSFEVPDGTPVRLRGGDEVTARAVVLEVPVEFRLGVLKAENRLIAIELDGFAHIGVEAALRPGRAGTRLSADVTIAGSDLFASLATAVLLAAAHGGALERVADGIAAEARRTARPRRPRGRPRK